MGTLLTALFFGFMTGFFRLYWDLNTSFHDGKNFSHLKRNLIIAPFCIVSIYYFALFLQINIVIALIISTFLFCANWLYFFSGIFNRKRNLNWWYLGNQTGKNAALTDRLLRKLKPKAHRYLVTGLMVISDIIYAIAKVKTLLIIAVIFSSCVKEYNNNEVVKYASRIALPVKVTLNCPPISDQGSEGSCVAWASTYYARSIEYFYSTGQQSYNSSNVFSPEYVYNQTKVSCQGGTSITACYELLKNQGVCLYSSMPGVDGDCDTQPDSTQRAEAANYKISAYSKIPFASRDQIKEALATNHPVVFSCVMDNLMINAPNDSNWTWKSKYPTGSFPHTMTLVGYDDSKNAYKVINQWGIGWGHEGYSWIDYNYWDTGKIIGTSVYVMIPAPVIIVPDTFSLSGYTKIIKGKVNDVLSWNLKYTTAPKTISIEYLGQNIYYISELTGTYIYKPNTKLSRVYRIKVVKSDNTITYSNTIQL